MKKFRKEVYKPLFLWYNIYRKEIEIKIMKKEINLKLILAIAIASLGIIGLYVGDYFLVETYYKSVPVYYQHIFGNDLATYLIYDHIVSGIVAFLVMTIINLSIYLTFRKK